MSSATQLGFGVVTEVRSVIAARTNAPLITAACHLWLWPNDVVLDATYGNGNFWTDWRPGQMVTNDWDADKPATFHHDFRELPDDWERMYDLIVFDPPYIPQGGRDHMPGTFLDNYGLREGPRNQAELEALWTTGLGELYRCLAPAGRLMVKCCDYVNGRKYVKGRHFMVTTAESMGLVQVDEFVHHSGPGPGNAREVDDMQHSRRVHSFLCVFQKRPLRGRPRSIPDAQRPRPVGQSFGRGSLLTDPQHSAGDAGATSVPLGPEGGV